MDRPSRVGRPGSARLATSPRGSGTGVAPLPQAAVANAATSKEGTQRRITRRSVTVVALALLVVAPRLEWVLLAYRLPREPSTPRITVWRKLRRLGVAQLVDGLVALPADARTKEQLEWVAEEIVDAAGEATIWTGRPGSAADERRLAGEMAAAVAAEYDGVVAAAEAAVGDPSPAARRRTAARLERELQRIARRDFFPPLRRDQAHAAVRRLAAEEVAR